MALFGGGLGAKFSLCCLIYFLKSIWWYNAVYISMCHWYAKGLRDFLFYVLIVETINESFGLKAIISRVLLIMITMVLSYQFGMMFPSTIRRVENKRCLYYYSSNACIFNVWWHYFQQKHYWPLIYNSLWHFRLEWSSSLVGD